MYFYNISKTALQRWLKDSSIKQTRNKPPTKIPNEALLKDVEQHPDDYLYERARRFNCSKTGMHNALKRLGISQKKDLRASKSLPEKERRIRVSLIALHSKAIPLCIWMKAALRLKL
ncbi:IS630 transposase-related protein [Psychrobacter sp. WY6]|uniref:IS630 transposase-related protein n=1 Tax=Psychrobacter sp. WY6 TaxID=2708350 RepID=UPI002022E54D|nr:IS630 transposase-related protein [Psychrobacter sp. WY6]